MSLPQAVWQQGPVRPVPVSQLGEHYRRYRLADGVAEDAILASLLRHGQLTPVIACTRQGRVELLDGFKRRSAALRMPGLTTLSTRVLDVDEQTAKAALLACNSLARPTQELEEAWIVHALVREDGLTQVEVAELLGRHKSWVCRRLALLEKLSDEVREDLRLGLVSLRLARQLTALPVGNQQQVLASKRREALTSLETRGVIELLTRASSPEQEQFVLQQPREALRQAQGIVGPVHDPRLSVKGNQLARRLTSLLQAVDHLDHWLDYPGLYELKHSDRELLCPRLLQLAEQARLLADHVEQRLAQLQRSEQEGWSKPDPIATS